MTHGSDRLARKDGWIWHGSDGSVAVPDVLLSLSGTRLYGSSGALHLWEYRGIGRQWLALMPLISSRKQPLCQATRYNPDYEIGRPALTMTLASPTQSLRYSCDLAAQVSYFLWSFIFCFTIKGPATASIRNLLFGTSGPACGEVNSTKMTPVLIPCHKRAPVAFRSSIRANKWIF